MVDRIECLNRLYSLVWEAEKKFGLWDYSRFESSSHALPEAGVYYFFEPGELRAGYADWHRIVRVGTHRVSVGSKSLLADRLRNHFGASATGIGRSSIFRDHVGAALFGRSGWETHADEVSQQRHNLVSTYIRSMTFVVIPVDDAAGSKSERRFIEMNSIALLSNYLRKGDQIDPPSANWLGYRTETKTAPGDHVSKSGLWNVDGVDGQYSLDLLSVLERRISS